MPYYVYILASRRNGTLYVGVTNDLPRRAFEHREGVVESFTRRHGIKLLVHAEPFEDERMAIQREKRLKKWPRARSEEHTSELQSLMRISYAVFCLKKNTNDKVT